VAWSDFLTNRIRSTVARVLQVEGVAAAQPQPKPQQATQQEFREWGAPSPGGPREAQYSVQRPVPRTEWEVGDDDVAWIQAESGQLQLAVQLCEAIEADGVARGLLDTRSSGLLRLPVTITGESEIVDALTGGEKSVQTARSGLLWRMFPMATLARLIRIGILLGAGVGYFVQGPDDPCPVLHACEHQFLVTRRGPDGHSKLYYRTLDGEVEVTPGDGRWFVFAPYGLDRFWVYGAWRAVGKFWLAKNAAVNQRNTWGLKLAQGILWITAPNSSTDAERTDLTTFLTNLVAPPILTMLEGWKLNHQDIQGQGFQVWKDGKDDANDEIRMALSGQPVTSGGQSLGFGSGKIFADIAKSLIDSNAETLAEAVHFHGLAPWADSRDQVAPWVEWDTTPPEEKKLLGEALSAYGKGLSDAAKGHTDIGSTKKLNESAYAAKMGIELEDEQAQSDAQTIQISGVKVRLEFPEGSIRTGTNSQGESWSTLMSGAGYGEIVGTEGEDGDPIDAYIGPFVRAQNVFVLEQLNELGERDEFKVFLGFASLSHAQSTFRRLGRADLEGSWIELPAAFIGGIVSGNERVLGLIDPSLVETEAGEHSASTNQTAQAGTEGDGGLFAYYLTSNVIKMNEARVAAGQPRDERMGEMYPAEWEAYLRAEAEKKAAPANENGDGASGATTSPSPLVASPPTLPAAPAEITVEAEDTPEIDDVTYEEAQALAEDMTLHGYDRCECGRVSKCERCGVRRVRGVKLDENGKPAGWKIAWRPIKQKVEPVAAEAPQKYKHIDFTPPKGAREEAQRGLDWRKEFGRGGTEVGIARARDISNGERLSPETLRRMKAFFDRHENGAGKGSKPGEDGFPSPWRIAWALWGGDAGYAWARKVVRQMEAVDESE